MKRLRRARSSRSGERLLMAAILTVALSLTAGCALLEPADESVAATSDSDGQSAESSADEGNTVDDGDGGDGGDADDTGDAASSATEATEATEATSTTSSTAPAAVDMPDLVGLTESEARALLSGLGLGEPSIETRESFESPGTVLQQLPSAGSTISGTISLVVAESVSPMPDFVDSRIAEVRAWADERAIEVRTETSLTDELPPGQVVSQIPGPGAQVGQEIVVTVADAPVIVELAEFGSLDSYYADRGEIQMNGEIFPDTVYLSTRTTRTVWIDYNLSRDWSTLKASLGVSDEHSAAAVVQVEIKGDDEVLYSEAIGFGTLTEIELDVTNVLRLQVTANRIDGDPTLVGLGDARLIGGAATGG